MSPPQPSPATLWISLMMALSAVCPACAREKHTMPAAQARTAEARQVFTDPGAAAVADAIADGDIGRVRALAKGTDLGTRGDQGMTLLQWALFHRNAEALQALLDAGADPAQPGVGADTVIHLAAMADDPDYLRMLLAHGASPDALNPESGATPLRSALIGERPLQFRALLAAGADPDRPDRLGNTPLHIAGQINEPARVLDLLNAGADPGLRNAQGATFQRYLFMTRPELLNAETRCDREAVQAWLQAHGIALETGGH